MESGARLVGCLTRLRELLGARAFLQFVKVGLGLAQRCFGGIGRRHLAIGFGLADQAALHQAAEELKKHLK